MEKGFGLGSGNDHKSMFLEYWFYINIILMDQLFNKNQLEMPPI